MYAITPDNGQALSDWIEHTSLSAANEIHDGIGLVIKYAPPPVEGVHVGVGVALGIASHNSNSAVTSGFMCHNLKQGDTSVRISIEADYTATSNSEDDNIVRHPTKDV